MAEYRVSTLTGILWEKEEYFSARYRSEHPWDILIPVEVNDQTDMEELREKLSFIYRGSNTFSPNICLIYGI